MKRHRRFVVIVLALAISALLLRSQLSSALVTRGDTLAYWGHREAARRAYAKALAFDPTNGVAADRLVFDAAVSDDVSVVRYGISVATRYLSFKRDDPSVLADRALCYQHLSDYKHAIRDFLSAGKTTRDPRLLLFAALDERRINHRGAARRLMRFALSVDGDFAPAERDLRTLK